MYCGESFDIYDAKSIELPESALHMLEIGYHKALEEVMVLIEDYEQLLSKFNKKEYSTSFEQYVQKSNSLLLPSERYALISQENVSKVSEEISKTLIELIGKDIAKAKDGMFNSEKTAAIEQYRFLLTVYTVPMILHLKYRISEPLADAILAAWGKQYPKFIFKKGNFDSLLAGFERKGFFRFF
jgi:hypothetical protein